MLSSRKTPREGGLDMERKIILEFIAEKLGKMMRTGFIWLKIRISGELLNTGSINTLLSLNHNLFRHSILSNSISIKI